MNKFWYFILIAISYLAGCDSTKEETCIILPNIINTKCTTIKELDNFYTLKFENYRGFTGVMEDSVLRKFTVLMDNQSQKVGRDVLEKKNIEKLREEKFIGLKFEKISDSEMSYPEVLEYISNIFPNLLKENNVSKLEIGIDYETIFKDKSGNPKVRVQYSKLGISGTFVVLDCTSCN